MLAATGFLAGAADAQGLSVWTTFDGRTQDWLASQTASFTSAFGVDVQLVQLDVAELKQRALLGAADGEAADVFVGVPQDEVSDLMARGVLADLSSYATADYLADLSDQARLAFDAGSGLFGLPIFVEGPALVLNTDLVTTIPTSYQDLVSLATSLTTPESFGFLFDIENFYFAYAWIHSHGGYVFGRSAGVLDPTDIGLADDGAIQGAKALKALRFVDGLIPAGMDFDTAERLFAEGSAAMIYTGPWDMQRFLAAGRNVAVVPMPPLVDGTPWSGFMSVQGVLVNQFSTDKRDAANLAKWLTRKDALVALAETAARTPASLSALAAVQDDPIVAGFGRALLNSEPVPNIPAMGQVWGPMGAALSAINENADSDVAAALSGAVKEIERRRSASAGQD